MSADDLLQRVRARPFVPFRLVLTEGTPYEVRHPDHIMVTRTIASIGRPSEDEQSLFESVVWVFLLHIVRLEPLDSQKPAGKDGAVRQLGRKGDARFSFHSSSLTNRRTSSLHFCTKVGSPERPLRRNFPSGSCGRPST